MLIGDRRTERIHLGEYNPKPYTGTVVWIHPLRRFYVVEFELGERRLRESYFFPHRAGTLPEHWNSCKPRLPGEVSLEPHKCYKRDRQKPEKGIEP